MATTTPFDFQSWKQQTIASSITSSSNRKTPRSKRRHSGSPGKQHLPTEEELLLLEQQRVKSQQHHSMVRAKELLMKQLVAKQEQERLKMEYKQKLKKSRLQQLESKAQRRIVKTLREEEEGDGRRFLLGNGHMVAGSSITSNSISSTAAPHTYKRPYAAAGGTVAAAGGGGARPSLAAHTHIEPWAATVRQVKCESVSALVRTTLAFAQTLRGGAAEALLGGDGDSASPSPSAAVLALPPSPPPPVVLSGLFDQMLIVGLPLEYLREPIVSLHSSYTPQIVYTFPEGALCAEAITDFCLPQGVMISPLAVARTGTTTITTTTNNNNGRASSSAFSFSPLPSSSEEVRQRSQLTATALDEVKEVLFVLSGGGADGSRTSYGMCLHLRRPYRYSDKMVADADICYCFISQHPFLPLHLGVLRAIVRLHLSPEFWSLSSNNNTSSGSGRKGALSPSPSTKPFYLDELERERQAILKITAVLERFAPVAIPNPGEEVEFSVFEGLPQALTVPTYFRRPPSSITAGGDVAGGGAEAEGEADKAPWIREWAVPMLLCTMSLEKVLLVLFSMLTEMQVLVISKDLQLLSAAVLSWTSLLRPLGWAGPLIVTLPEKHNGYLESPVPFVISMEELPAGFLQPKGMIIVYPDRDQVMFHPTEVDLCQQMVSHQIGWLMASVRETQRGMVASAAAPLEAAAAAGGPGAGGGGGHDHRPTSKQHQKQRDDERSSHQFMTPQRIISPAYRKEPSPGSFLSNSSSTSAAAGNTADLPSSTTSTHSHAHTKTPHTMTNMDRRMIEEVILKIHEHLTAIAEMGLNIDLCYRPKRPVVDRRRSSIVEEKTLDSDTKAWWDECLGEAGAIFMKRFMQTQLYCNHRYSDAVRKRDLNRAMGVGSFSPRYRPLSPCSRPKTSHVGRELSESVMVLPHHQGLAEIFQLAIFGALPSSSSSPFASWLDITSEKQAQRHLDPALRYKPCNGICGGRSNTPDCTLLCLEAWQIKLVHARRKEIIKEERLLVAAQAKHTDYQELIMAKAPHSREIPSQYRRRLRLAASLPNKKLSPQKKWRLKGQRILRFRAYKKYKREQLQLFNHAALIITRAIRRLAAWNSSRELVQGVVLIQAQWRRYKLEKKYREAKALDVLQGALSRYSLRLRSRRSLLTGGGSAVGGNNSSFGFSLDVSGQRESNVSSSDGSEESGVAKDDEEGGGGGGKRGAEKGKKQEGSRLWHYIMKRRNKNQSRRPQTAPAGTNGGAESTDNSTPTPSSDAVATSGASSTHPPPARATSPPATAAPSSPSSSSSSQKQGSNARLFSSVAGLMSLRARTGVVKMTTLMEAGDLDEEEEEVRREGDEHDHHNNNRGQERRLSAARPRAGTDVIDGAAGVSAGTSESKEKLKSSPLRWSPAMSAGGRLQPPRMATAVGSLEGGSPQAQPSSSSSSTSVVSRPSPTPLPARRASPLLLARGPSFGRGIVAIEKGPLPLQELRKGLRVHKFGRKGRPEKRVFLLEDKGSLAYAPRLAWRPATMIGRISRSLLHGEKPCHLDLVDAFGRVDSSGKTPRIIMAITNRPPLLHPVGPGDQARYLTFALSSASDSDRAYEFALLPKKGMTTEEAINYHMSLLATLQTLCSTRGAPAHTQSPRTPKP